MNDRRTLIWGACVAALIPLGLAREGMHAPGSGAYHAGEIAGAITAPLFFAVIVWWIVHGLIRKRRGYPPTVGIIAVGISLAFLAGAAVSKASTCDAGLDPFGPPAAGFTYEPAGADTRAALTRLLPVTPVDVKVVMHRGSNYGLLLAVKADRLDHDVRDFAAGARRRNLGRVQMGNDSRGKDIAFVDMPDGSRITAAIRGCRLVIAIGATVAAADELTRGITD